MATLTADSANLNYPPSKRHSPTHWRAHVYSSMGELSFHQALSVDSANVSYPPYKRHFPTHWRAHVYSSMGELSYGQAFLLWGP